LNRSVGIRLHPLRCCQPFNPNSSRAREGARDNFAFCVYVKSVVKVNKPKLTYLCKFRKITSRILDVDPAEQPKREQAAIRKSFAANSSLPGIADRCAVATRRLLRSLRCRSRLIRAPSQRNKIILRDIRSWADPFLEGSPKRLAEILKSAGAVSAPRHRRPVGIHGHPAQTDASIRPFRDRFLVAHHHAGAPPWYKLFFQICFVARVDQTQHDGFASAERARARRTPSCSPGSSVSRIPRGPISP